MGKPNFRLLAAILISHAAAIPAPPPVQAPEIAAIVGTVQVSIAVSTASIRPS
jgi:hypothetical protein